MSAILLALLLSFNVRHNHSIGSCEGVLTFSEDEVRFQAKEKSHGRRWSYPDVKYFEILSTREIEIHTYESQGLTRLAQDRDYKFRLAAGDIEDSLYQFLVKKSPRAVVTRVVFRGTEVVQEIPVRHRHRIGGCQGILTIATDKIIFRSDGKQDSRIWRLGDLQSFASSDSFSLRLSTAFETFTFDLKLPLQPKAYDLLWRTVYAPGVQTYGDKSPH